MDDVDGLVAAAVAFGVAGYLMSLVFAWSLLFTLLCAALVVLPLLAVGGKGTLGYSLIGLGFIAFGNSAGISMGFQGIPLLCMLAVVPVFQRAWHVCKARRSQTTSSNQAGRILDT